MDTKASMHASHPRRCAALRAAISAGVFTDDTPSAIFMDSDQLTHTCNHIKNEAGYPGKVQRLKQ
jgi:citrate lyase beta subunit